jgi:hypothetical protein
MYALACTAIKAGADTPGTGVKAGGRIASGRCREQRLSSAVVDQASETPCVSERLQFFFSTRPFSAAWSARLTRTGFDFST